MQWAYRYIVTLYGDRYAVMLHYYSSEWLKGPFERRFWLVHMKGIRTNNDLEKVSELLISRLEIWCPHIILFHLVQNKIVLVDKTIRA